MTTVTEVQSASFGLALHAHHIFSSKFFLFSRHLRFTGYSFPFHMHILCTPYGTVLTNTAVLTMHVCIVFCLYPWWVLLQHSIMLRLLFIIKCGIKRFLCVYSTK